MTAPRLNRQLVLETPERVIDGAGGFNQTWVTLGTLWADVQSRAGKELSSASAPLSQVSYRIIVRGAPHGDEQRPVPEQRFVEQDRVFNITAVTELDADARYLVCFADEELVT